MVAVGDKVAISAMYRAVPTRFELRGHIWFEAAPASDANTERAAKSPHCDHRLVGCARTESPTSTFTGQVKRSADICQEGPVSPGSPDVISSVAATPSLRPLREALGKRAGWGYCRASSSSPAATAAAGSAPRSLPMIGCAR